MHDDSSESSDDDEAIDRTQKRPAMLETNFTIT